MSEFNSGRAKAWNIYSSSNPSPSQTDVDKEGPWKSFGSSMNAISFGFVATAILISMFLIMAIFEHLFRPNASQDDSGRLESRQMHKLGTPQLGSVFCLYPLLVVSVFMPGRPGSYFYRLLFLCKCVWLKVVLTSSLLWWQVQTSYASDFSVVMPGQQYPTFIAQPAPLPCPREGVQWPSHLMNIQH